MLYLVDKPHADLAIRTAEAAEDPTIVLIQDGVLLEPDTDIETFAVEDDVTMRGVDLPPEIEPVSYDRLVEWIFEQEVKTFV